MTFVYFCGRGKQCELLVPNYIPRPGFTEPIKTLEHVENVISGEDNRPGDTSEIRLSRFSEQLSSQENHFVIGLFDFIGIMLEDTSVRIEPGADKKYRYGYEMKEVKHNKPERNTRE